MDPTHIGLLKAMARNTNDQGAIRAYGDYLQEVSNPGWIIVLNYKMWEWPLIKYVDNYPETPYESRWVYLLPWMSGPVKYRSISHHLKRMKYILTEYAEGNIQ